LPSRWYSWVVTSITQDGAPKPLFSKGQLIAFDAKSGYTCRLNQQNLLNITDIRPIDYCDYTSKQPNAHSLYNHTEKCAGTYPLAANLTAITFPAPFLASAKFFGVDHINQVDCNHFVAIGVVIDDVSYQMDVWTSVGAGYPCQIAVTETGSNRHTTWAFDGFHEEIPVEAINQCSIPNILCNKNNWVCRAKATSTDAALGDALSWVCGAGLLDCAPINPGGDHFYPNTVRDHCNWAFNAYFYEHRTEGGISACDFGSNAELVPPTSFNVLKAQRSLEEVMNYGAVFSNDLVCERS